jgi:SAM-dependent methyltransferase
MEPLFEFVDHPVYPEYQICKKTGTCKYLPAKARIYSDSYFCDEYKNQYKKTYYEDEPFLRELARRRLFILQKYLASSNPSLLEIGSASGFFLDEAKKAGFSVTGVEVSKTESDYSKNLGLDTFHGSFIDFQTDKKYTVICAFFVIEHFQNQQELFEKFLSLLEPEGFLFLALPSLFGPSFQTNPTDWFATHPEDHFIDYSPTALKRLSKRIGLRLVYKEPMSYHVHRDRGLRGLFPLKLFYRTLAKLTCYGDTMQVLLQKEK